MSNIILNAGAGGSTLATDLVAGIDYQKVKVTFSTDGVAPTSVDASHPLPVVQTGALPAGANVIGAVTQSGGPWTDNLTQLAGTAVDVNSGVKSAGTLRVVLATDQPSLTNALAVAQSGSWSIVNISGTVSLPTGASTSAKQPALGTAGAAAADVITVQGIAAMTPLKVDGSGVTQPVSGTVTANQGTAAAGSAAWPVNLVEDTTNTVVHPGDATNKAVRVNVVAGAGSGGTALADGSTFARGTTSETPAAGVAETSAPTLTNGKAAALSLDLAGNLRVNVVTGGGAGGTSIADGSTFARGTTSETPAGALAETAAPTLTTGKVGALSMDLSGNLRTTVANGVSSGTAGTPSANVITVQGVASMTPVDENMKQINGTTADTNSGNKSAGTLRVVIATDQPSMTNAQPVTQSGGPWSVIDVPATSGGWTPWSTPNNNGNAPLSTTQVNVKASAGQLGGYIIYNPNATVAYVQVFDANAAVTLGTTRPNVVIPIPPTSGANIEIGKGIAFATGIRVAATTTASGSTAPGTGLDCTFLFK